LDSLVGGAQTQVLCEVKAGSEWEGSTTVDFVIPADSFYSKPVAEPVTILTSLLKVLWKLRVDVWTAGDILGIFSFEIVAKRGGDCCRHSSVR
jgi:hypothetical protein